MGHGHDASPAPQFPERDATAKAVSVSVSVAMASFSSSDLNTTAKAESTGVDGGGGRDAIVNEGLVDVHASSKADGGGGTGQLIGYAAADITLNSQAQAVAIAGGAGDDILVNRKDLGAHSDALAVGRTVSVNLAGYVSAKAGVDAQSTAVGIQGGAGEDLISNEGKIDLFSKSKTDLTGVSVTLGGYSRTNAGNNSSAFGRGIEGGEDGDKIWNAAGGSILAAADASGKAGSVTVPAAGAAFGNAGTTVQAEASGIDGGSGEDGVLNEGTVTAGAKALADASSTSVTILGYAAANTNLTGNAFAKGISGGSGDDILINAESGIIGASTDVTAKSGNVSVPGLGAAFGKVGSTAAADSAGMAGETGDDRIVNKGSVTAVALSLADATNTTVTVGGYSRADAELTAKAYAKGLSGGDGRDWILNKGTSNATADSTAKADGTSVSVFGAGGQAAVIGAISEAGGIDGGEAPDLLENQARVTVKAKATTSFGGGSFSFGGYASDNAQLSSTARGIGLSGGEGDDWLKNSGAGADDRIEVRAEAILTANGGSDVGFGDSESGSTSGAFAVALGMDGGEGHDRLENLSKIDAGSTSTLTLDSSNFTFGGAAGVGGTLTASTTAVGISGGAGDDYIGNQGTILASAAANMTAKTGSDVAFGVSEAGAASGAVTLAIGIDGGEGKDFIGNTGTITVNSSGNMTLDGSAYTFGGKSQTGGQLTAATHSLGIAGGGGDDTICNEGTISVAASSNLAAGGRVETTFGTASGGAPATGQTTAAGIAGGEGDDEIKNSGKITVNATAQVTSDKSAYVFGGSSETGAVITALAEAVGLQGGKGNDRIWNEGEVNVSAQSSLTATGGAYAEFGNSRSGGLVTAEGKVTGIDGGEGDDIIVNRGTLNVAGTASASSVHSTDTGWLFGGGDSNAFAAGSIKGWGIDAGEGNNRIWNEGSIIVALLGWGHAKASSDGADIFDGDAYSRAEATGDAEAIGIRAGDGDNRILNTGAIRASTSRQVWVFNFPTSGISEANADGDGIDGDGTIVSIATVRSSAIGIDVGGGDNRIVNTGTIQATATAYPVAWGSVDSDAGGSTSITKIASVEATAWGIRTGNGNNQIENDGELTFAATVSSEAGSKAEVRAFGIAAGSGNDAVQIGKNAKLSGAAKIEGSFYSGFAAATGIDAGHGRNDLEIEGKIQIGAEANALIAKAEAAGIITGSGPDKIRIGGEGEIAVAAKAAGLSASASATGIDAGDGDNCLVNAGSLSVAAEASGFGKRTRGIYGIKSGSGNDFILNSGSIDVGVKGIPGPGVAISSGAGNDLAVFLKGSTTLGAVDLGSGDDTLWFVSDPTVRGKLEGGEGTDSLVLENAGAFSGEIARFEKTVKRGPGTYTVDGLPTMRWLEVSGGTLQINAPYRFAADGTYRTSLFADGTSGRLQIAGAGDLNGTLSVLRGCGAFQNGMRFTLIEAQSLNGAFSKVELPASTSLVSFRMNQLPQSVQVETAANPFTTVATNKTERIIAQSLDRALPAASTDFADVLGAFQLTSDSGHRTAFSSLSPSSYDSFTLASYQGVWKSTQNLQHRMDTVRSGASGQEKPVLLAYGGSESNLDLIIRPGQYDFGKTGLWVNGFGQWGDQEEASDFNGYKYGISGVTVGLDHRVSRNLLAGFSLAYSATDINFDHQKGDGDIHSVIGSFYGSYFTGDFYAEGALSYGKNNYKNNRNVVVGSIQRQATSEHDGDLFSAYAGAGYNFRVSQWILGPYAMLRYSYLDEEGFQESGGGAAGLQLESRETGSLISELGLKISRVFRSEKIHWVPELSFGWSYDFDLDDRTITTQFLGAPGAAFSIRGQEVEQHGFTFGAGISLIHEKGFSASLKYRGETRENSSAHGILGELRYRF